MESKEDILRFLLEFNSNFIQFYRRIIERFSKVFCEVVIPSNIFHQYIYIRINIYVLIIYIYIYIYIYILRERERIKLKFCRSVKQDQEIKLFNAFKLMCKFELIKRRISSDYQMPEIYN